MNSIAHKKFRPTLALCGGVVPTRFERLRRSAAVCALALLVELPQAHAADPASPWDGDARSAMRLIAGSSAAPTASAGIEIRLKPGWHTYWRYPGDAGVPPRFDFAGSRNLESATVLWPAPRRIQEQGLNVIGYMGNLILPLVVAPEDRASPVTLRLKLDYAVCEKLCVPAEARAELTLAGAPSPYDAALAEAQAAVPKKRALGQGDTLAIRALRRDKSHPGSSAIIDVVAPPETNVDLFVEGPTAEWALPVPVRSAPPAAGVQRFVFDLDGAPPGTNYAGALITLTAVAGNEAVEVTAPLQ
jgi:DsbC/DsbD-like thiol-disulfide interchange protein